MLFDHLKQTDDELVGHVKAACLALKFLRNVEPLECVRGGPQYVAWVQHMNALNTARVRLGMAVESLHEHLNRFNEAVIEAARSGEERAIIQDYGDDDYHG